MRKALIWIMVVAMTMTIFTVAVAESTSTAVNGEGAVRTNSELYTIFSDNGEDVLIRISSSGDAVCIDRAADIDSMVPYAGGIAYLKTNDGNSSIILYSGSSRSVMYSFENGMVCENLSVYNDNLLVLSGNLLYSVDPNDQICLKLSGAQILDYCVGGDYAYFMSGTDMMQYSADITENEETVTKSVEVGCIYRLDLTSGETTLMLKSGGTDPKLKNDELYFHSMQQIYAIREGDEYELRGRLYSLNISEKNLNAVCSENDTDFWPLDGGVVVLVGNALKLQGTDARTLYETSDDAQVVSDGNALYVWEPAEQKLTRVQAAGTSDSIYTGAIGDIRSLDAATPVPEDTETPAPAVTAATESVLVEETEAVPTAEPTSLTDYQFDANADNSTESVLVETPAPTPLDGGTLQTDNTESALADDGDWFDEFMDESDNIQNGADATLEPGATPTPEPIETIREETTVKPTITAVPDSYLSTTTISSNGIRAIGGAANMRIGPGTDYEKIGSVPEGSVATSLGLAAKASNGTTWYKVYYNGMTGWVSSKYSEPTSAKGPAVPASGTTQDETTAVLEAYTTYAASGNYVHITGGDSNIRSGASTDYTVLTSAPNGAYGTFEGLYAINESGSKWYKITYNGVTGWVSASLSEVTNEKKSSSSSNSSGSSSGKVKTTGNVTIRKKPNKTSEKLGYIGSGVTVTYLGSSSVDSRGVRWYKIRYDGITGWISSKYSKLK